MVCYLTLADDDKSPTEVSFQSCLKGKKKKSLGQRETGKLVVSFYHQAMTSQQHWALLETQEGQVLALCKLPARTGADG